MKNSMKRFIECLFVIIPFVVVSTIIAAPVPPELPRVYVDTTYTEPTGQRIDVFAGGSIQAAIDSANPGDIIELQPGISYSGSFTLRTKNNPLNKWIVIRTKGFDVPEGQRVQPSDAIKMARIETGGIEDFIFDEAGANYYRFIGIEVLAQGVTKRIFDLGDRKTSDPNQQSHHIILDRMYIHAEDSAQVKTAVRINGSHQAVIDSYISNISFTRSNGNNWEAQAVSGQNGAGPFKIVNNFLEAAGINFIYGGGVNPIPAHPSDFEIRRNHFHKNPKWHEASALPSDTDGKYITVKNLLEVKTGTRVLIDGNIFDRSWAAHDQKGYAIGLKQKTTEGENNDIVQDITITNNIIAHANIGVSISPRSVDISRVKIENNLGIDLHHMHGEITGDRRGTAFDLSHTGWANENNININHNTMLNSGRGGGVRTYTSKRSKGGCGKKHINVAITNNFYNGGLQDFDEDCNPKFINRVMENNEPWSPDMFINYTNDLSGNYRLKNPDQHPGTDGKPVGADIDTIMAAIGGELPLPTGGGGGSTGVSTGGSTDNSSADEPTSAPADPPAGSPETPGSPRTGGTPSRFSRLYEMEAANLLSSDIAIGDDASAFNGQYISTVVGVKTDSPTREASLSFQVSATDTYYLWARIYGPTDLNDSLNVGIDQSWDRVFPSTTGLYEWVRVENSHNSGAYGFSLSAGAHVFQIGHREINSRVDVLFLTNDAGVSPPEVAPSTTSVLAAPSGLVVQIVFGTGVGNGGGSDVVIGDVSSSDAGSNDAGSNDAGSNDAGSNDAGSNDAGSNDAGNNTGSDLGPVSILFDTDIGPDVDDAGALAVLHALADNGEVQILGVANGTLQAFGAPALDAINTYYGRPNIPVGTLKGSEGVMKSSSYNQHIAQNFPNDLKNGDNAEDATAMYRRVLAAQPDKSVVFVVVGFKRNLANLLKSSPDQHSSLNGIDLVNKKVKSYVDMGGQFPGGSEFNFVKDPSATQYVFENWPTPIVFSGYEIGVDISTGSCLRNTSSNNPVRKSYELYFGGEAGSRSSWDLTAVLYAARGTQNYWTTSAEGSIILRPDGRNTWDSSINKNHSYLKKRMSDSEMENAISELLCQAPV